MQNYSIKVNYIASEGQQVFNIGVPFIDGTIDVYLNGNLQAFGITANYVTIPDNGRVIFNQPLALGDIVAISQNETVNTICMTVVSYGNKDLPNALFKRFSSVVKLKANNRYRIHLKIDDTVIDWSFVTKFTPMFSTVKKILEDIGEFIPGFTEEYISSIIHRNSWEIINNLNAATTSNKKVNATVTLNTTTNDYTSTAKAVYSWVRTKTEIDLIYARYYGISYNYGAISKTIGDIKIEKTTNLPLIDELLKRKKNENTAAEETIFGGKTFVNAFVKGSTTFTYSERGTF